MAFPDRWAYPIKCTHVVMADDKASVHELHVEYDRTKSVKPKVSTRHYSRGLLCDTRSKVQ